MPRRKDTETEVNKEETIDTKKVLKDLKQELNDEKDRLVDEMNSSINEKIEFNVNKRMKEEEKRIVRGKNIKIINRDIFIVFLILVLGYCGYCLYKIDYFELRGAQNSPISIDDNKDKEEDKKPSSEYYIENFGYLVDNLQIEDPSIYELYNISSNEVAMNEDLILKIAYKNMADSLKVPANGIITFADSELLNSAKNIFGDNVVLNHKSFVYGGGRFIYYNGQYIGEANLDNDGSSIEDESNGPVYKIYSAEEKDDVIYFDVVIGKLIDMKLFNLNDEEVLSTYNGEDITLYKDNLSKYRFAFGKQGNKYVFYKVEQIN